MKKIKIAIAGCGNRGSRYGDLITERHDFAEVVAVAEPREERRKAAAKRYGLEDSQLFPDWQTMAKQEKVADAIIIATQDQFHSEPAIAFAKLGYDMLLEKPMAPSAEECKQITKAVQESGILFTVCHVMLYTDYTKKMKSLLDDGVVGDIVSVQHLEPLGYWHQAHSYVRGNWRSEKDSSPMLLAKSCHDLDWLRYVVGEKCEMVSSFGSNKHFVAKNKPEGASDRCVDCSIERDCPYSAKKIYLDRFEKGERGWPYNVLELEPTYENLSKAIETGPYGRCVYACDNDVVDHQVVNMQFSGGATASFTMTAFNEGRGRETYIFGTHGEIFGDGRMIRVFNFLSDEKTEYDTQIRSVQINDGHGGGDSGIIEAWLKAVSKGDKCLVLSGPDETLESHLMVFASEEARKESKVIHFD